MRRLIAPLIAACLAPSALGSDCSVTSVGLTPLNQLGSGLYLGQFQGGLYPAGLNAPPAQHTAVGLDRAQAIVPRDQSGAPSANGRYVLLSIGMSNTTQEFCSQGSTIPCDPYTFVGQASVDQRVDRRHLALANGAAGGQTASTWDSPSDPNYERIRTQVLLPQGLTEAQVQVAWVKVANAQPTISLPSPAADAYALVTQTGNIVRALKVRYPNLQQVYLSSRIYAGYASSTLNPEPYAYESAFAVKWLVEAQINQMGGGPVDPLAGDLNYNTVAPWLAWGPYLWADGLTPRNDGLTWACADFSSDGTHPATSGRQKVGTLLLDFFLGSPFSQLWFRSGLPAGCYANCDQSTVPPVLNVNDFLCFQAHFAGRDSYANCDGSTAAPLLNVNDFTCFMNRFAAGCQ
jgi:hypothetical protein